MSNIDNYWNEPEYARWLLRLASYARVVMFDKRGTGMSDQVTDLAGLDQRMDDLRAVMDAAGMDRAAVFGFSEGGTLAALFAATYPERCRALVLWGAFASFAHWCPTEEAFAAFLGYIDQAWGTGASLPMFAPSRANDPAFQRWWGQFERLGANPRAATALIHMVSQIDISDIVPTIRVPTLVIHRTEDALINVEAGRFLAKHIPGARYLELPGADHIFFVGDNAGEIADAIQEFLTGSHAPVPVCLPRFSLLTLSARPRKLPRSATAAGAIFLKTITPRSGETSRASVVMRSRRLGTASLRLSMARRAVSAALVRLRRKYAHWGSMFVQGCIPASAK